MPPLYQQRAELIQTNTDLLLRWLALLDAERQRMVIESMVRSYKLPQLKDVHTHLQIEVGLEEAKQKPVAR
jgi:hypothetical protein